jgi:membrane AbrB-like protein
MPPTWCASFSAGPKAADAGRIIPRSGGFTARFAPAPAAAHKPVVTNTPNPLRADLRRTTETLLIAMAGGLAMGLSGLPAGWMSGAIIVVSVAALLGRPLLIPNKLAQITYVITGISLGGAVTPDAVNGMTTWPVSLLMLAVAMVVLTVVVTLYLQIVHGWDEASALLGSFPGGLATVMVLAVENKADVRGVAVVQTVRVVAIAVLLPLGLAVFGLANAPAVVRNSGLNSPGELALLVVVSTLVALAAQRFRFPGGLLFGAMVTSAVLHGAGTVHVTLPFWMSAFSFMVLGAVTGTRFANTDLRTLRRLAAAAFGALALGSLIAFAFAILTAWLLALDTGAVAIAYAPGAIEATMVVALALNYDPAFVGAHHLARFFLVLVSMPAVVRVMERVRTRRQMGGPPGDAEP